MWTSDRLRAQRWDPLRPVRLPGGLLRGRPLSTLTLLLALGLPGVAGSAAPTSADSPASNPSSSPTVTPALQGASAGLLRIRQFNPQKTVREVRQAVVQFERDAVRFGDPQAAAPLNVSCSPGAATAGTGRWNSSREWVYDFAQDLPAGVRCSFTPRAEFRAPGNLKLDPSAVYRFDTGGPVVSRIQPSEYGSQIEEDQYFLLTFTAPVSAANVQSHVWCKTSDLGERIASRLIDGSARMTVLKALGQDKAAAAKPDRLHVLSCQRRLSASADLQLQVDAGIPSLSGVVNQEKQHFDFQVRPDFSASTSCQRENAKAGCMPIRPLQLNFSSPISLSAAQAIRLRSTTDAGLSLKPQLEGELKPDSLVQNLTFAAPLPSQSELVLELPADLRDASGRALVNAASFPLKIRTAAQPALAKFSASPFGVVERYAEPDGPPVLPLTLRRVERDLTLRSVDAQQAVDPGQLRSLRPQTDAEIIDWWFKLQRFDGSYIFNTLPRTVLEKEGITVPPQAVNPHSKLVELRQISLLESMRSARLLELPKAEAGDVRPFEVVGVPLQPGFNVLEIASPLLGSSLLNTQPEELRKVYVRTSALVTNLGVHFKLGHENSLAWVTSLDRGAPVAGADVRVSNCKGQEIARATTDAEGVAVFPKLPKRGPSCQHAGRTSASYFISARAADTHGGTEPDMAFTWSDWSRGIENWRFNLPLKYNDGYATPIHTVLDRTLFRAGETVSMKHLLRQETLRGLTYTNEHITSAQVIHEGSGDEYELKLRQGSGSSMLSEFKIPTEAKLGRYQVVLKYDHDEFNEQRITSASFRVEEFRLPLLSGRIQPVQTQATQELIQPSKLPTRVQLDYVSGGPASHMPVRVSAMLRPSNQEWPDYLGFVFTPPPNKAASESTTQSESEYDDGSDFDEDASPDAQDTQVVLDKAALTLDAHGQGQLDVGPLPPSNRPRELVLEASYADPNGEQQTLSSRHILWPAAVQVAIRTDDWVSVGNKLQVQALALDLQGKPKAGVALSVAARALTTITSRKRLVGGFYSYEHQHQVKDLGQICQGKSDSTGRLTCSVPMEHAGEIALTASAIDAQDRSVQAVRSVWVTRQGELWFDAENNDRIDLLPERKQYQPGDTAVFQVRMPFRQATALVTIEREGILSHQLVQLAGDDPTIRLKVEADWGPNVFVSALVLRGRLYEVPWYSFFTWGYKAPLAWWRAYRYDGKDYVAPTSMVDLSKPAYRMGVAEIRVGLESHRLAVTVSSDKPSYQVRDKAQVTVGVKLPDGRPAAHAHVALAVVDQALLELSPNPSWQLLEAMYQRRGWNVETATAQMEIVGRRHYGRKAVPAGGDGGAQSSTRELFDTLLLWQPDLALDAQGQAQISVPLNDSLSRFRIVAIADIPQSTQTANGPAQKDPNAVEAGLFGTGWHDIRTSQDLQIISGLPPVVRDDDHYRAQITLRNSTARDMNVDVKVHASHLQLPDQQVQLAAGQAREIGWDVQLPRSLEALPNGSIDWRIEAHERTAAGTAGGAHDALQVKQLLLAAVPLSVQQATLVQVQPQRDQQPGTLLPIARPAQALAERGGLKISLQASLADGLDGVRDWLLRYPYQCLEQLASIALGLQDHAHWKALTESLPKYLDPQGLAGYFPSQRSGDVTLTAHLLTVSDVASQLDPELALPPAQRQRMQEGLLAFVEGRLRNVSWSPRPDLDLDMRKIVAIEALARGGKARPQLLESIHITPNLWPTHGVISWLSILQRMPTLPGREAYLKEAQSVLRARLFYQGSRIGLAREDEDDWYWFMVNGDVNSARLLLSVLDDAQWQDELPRMAQGLIQRQTHGAWQTTTANVWGTLALQLFARKFESQAVTGLTLAQLGPHKAQVDWSQVTRTPAGHSAPQRNDAGTAELAGRWQNNQMSLPWPQQPADLRVSQQGSGRPWMTVQALAAIPRSKPFNAGYAIKKTITAIEQARPGVYQRGDVLQVRLDIDASADMNWVALQDPIPAGSTILGSALGRDSVIANTRSVDSAADPDAQRPDEDEDPENAWSGSWDQPWLAYQERAFDAMRAYYQFLPKGRVSIEYRIRLNNVGDFALPATRIEAMYAPEQFGEWPNARFQVQGQP